MNHLPALDGVRGVAILSVLIAHAVSFFDSTPLAPFTQPLVAGWGGVDLFFVLSGFLITGILLRTSTASNRAKSFYARRVLRIFPIYYLTVFAVFLAAHYFPGLLSSLPYHSIFDRSAYALYLQNWLPLAHGMATPFNLLGHLWSLALEEQFYLLWPWIVWFTPRKALAPFCAVAVVCALLLRIGLVKHFGAHFWIHMVTPGRGEGLFWGSALATLVTGRKRLPAGLPLAMAALGSAVMAFIALADPAEFTNTDKGPYMYTIGVSAFCLLSVALLTSALENTPLRPALTAGWLRGFGRYSYGVYVYHPLVLFVFRQTLAARFGHVQLPLPIAATAFGVSIVSCYGLAWLSFRFIEEPFLRRKDNFKPVYRSI